MMAAGGDYEATVAYPGVNSGIPARKLVGAAICIYPPSARTSPFVPVNCARFPAELLESELSAMKKVPLPGRHHQPAAGRFEAAQAVRWFLTDWRYARRGRSHAGQAAAGRARRTFERVGQQQGQTADVRSESLPRTGS